jgi:hypothetical protein
MRIVVFWASCCRRVLLGALVLALSGLMLPGYALDGKSGSTEKPPETPKPATASSQSDLLRLTIEPLKEIFSSHEGLVMLFKWTAKNPVTLCLTKDFLSQTQVNIYRSGRGKLPLQPLIVRDNTTLYQEPMQVYHLKTGDSISRRANLKRYHFGEGESWIPGEYNVEASFNLCEQTLNEPITDPGQESVIHAVKTGWFMIMI